MTSHNEQPPIWIANWNHAGGPLVMGFVVCPVIAIAGGLVFWRSLSDGTASPTSSGGFRLVVVPVVIALAWMFYSLMFTTLWVRLAEDVVLRSALRTKRRPWSDVKRIRFYNQKGRLSDDRMLLIEIDDYNEIEVQVSHRQEQLVAGLVRQKGVEVSLQSPGTEELADVASEDGDLENDDA